MSFLDKTGLSHFWAQCLNKFATKDAIPSVEGLASESYVDNKVASMVDSAPETLNTLNELAAALGDDPNFATTVATEIGGKVSKSGDTMTGQLTATQLNASIGNSYTIMTASRDNKTTFLLQQDPSASRVQLMQIHPDSTFAERYRLPYANAEATADINYDILTSKSPVTIAQGGTGATTAQDAVHNLIRGNAIAPSIIELWPPSNTATHGGYLDFHFNQASDDYTSRIIESAKGELSINILGDVRLGTVTYGTWNGSAIPVAHGGTGVTSYADTTYTTARYRASSLNSTETAPTVNGVISWTYE